MYRILPIRADVVPALLLAAAACGGTDTPAATPSMPEPGPTAAVVDTMLATIFEASGPALPVAEATLSTRLMGAVTAVLVTEGSRVVAGSPLVRLDAADLEARAQQVAASVAAAEAAHRATSAQAKRIRALYADSAAPRAQLDAVEAELARATAGVEGARAGAAELNALRAYGVLRAPFSGTVTHRFVDAGDFAAPGTPLVTVQDASRLRISAAIPAAMARRVKAGQVLAATIEGEPVRAVVEGVVPSAATMYTINAIVSNPRGELPAGAAATLAVPAGTTERVLLVPRSAVVREGDLTGVRVVRDGRAELRWVRLGDTRGTLAVVRAGLQAGERVALTGGER